MVNDILNKIKKLPSPVMVSFCYMFCSVLQKCISLITVPILTRILTPAQYGQISVYSSWENIVAIVAALNLASNVYIKGLVKYESDRKSFTSSLQVLSFCSTIIVFIIVMFNIDFFVNFFGMPKLWIILLFIEVFFGEAQKFWLAWKRVENNWKTMLYITVSYTILNPFITLIAVTFAPTNIKGNVKIISSLFVLIIFAIPIIFTFFHKNNNKIRLYYIIDSLKISIPLVPHYLSQLVLDQFDRIMINKYCGSYETGIYSVTYNISQIMKIVINSINSTFIPWLYQSLSKKKYSRIKKLTNYLIIIVFLCIFLFILLAPELIKVILPSKYYEAIYLVAPISMSLFYIFIYTLFTNIELYFDRTYLTTIATLLTAVLNVFLNQKYIHVFGYQAAAYTTMACYIILMIMHYINYKNVLKKNHINISLLNIKLICSLLLFSFFIVIIYNFLIEKIYIRIIIMLFITFFIYWVLRLKRLNIKTGEN